MIFKGGEREQFSNWRPFTMLKVSYKIIAKALAIRISPILDMVCRKEHKRFIKGRHLLEAINALWETLEMGEETK